MRFGHISQFDPREAVSENYFSVVLFWKLARSEASALVHIPEFPLFILALLQPVIGYLNREPSVSQRGVQPVHMALPGQSHADERQGLKFAWHLGRYGLCSSGVLDCPLQNHIKAVSLARTEQKNYMSSAGMTQSTSR